MPVSRRSSRDVAAEITDLIIRKLEEGVPPWSRPWRISGGGGRPLRHCGTPYTGINTLYLWALGDAMGYRSRFWMTYRQAEALGANVRRGETGAISVYYSSFKKLEEHPETGKEVERNIRFLRHYIVFNADQIDALPAYFYAPDEPQMPVAPSLRQAAIDAFFAGIPADVRHGGNQAYFTPTFDYIQMPNRTSFRSMDLYASTRCHEAAHASGAAHRLDRGFSTKWTKHALAMEEATAELTASFLLADLGIAHEPRPDHAAYIASWLQLLKDEPRAIFTAASKAQAAADWMHTRQP